MLLVIIIRKSFSNGCVCLLIATTFDMFFFFALSVTQETGLTEGVGELGKGVIKNKYAELSSRNRLLVLWNSLFMAPVR